MDSARNGLLVCLLATLPCQALTGGPGMPEYMQFEESTNDNMVDPNTGNLTFTIPLVDVPGPEGGYQVPLSYHSGIQHDQEATWVGLGWSLNAGSINRMVRGTPDDYMNGLSTTQNIGSASADYMTVGLGLGPVGLSMTWDIDRGELIGTEGSFSLAGMLNLVIPGGASPVAQFLVNHFDIQLSSEGLTVGARLGNGEGTLASISMGTDGHTSIGMAGMVNLAASGLGIGSAPQSGHGTGTVTTYGVDFPLLGFLNIGASGWRWDLNETFKDRNIGYLWQGGSVSGVVPHRPNLGTPKNERLKFGSDLVPSGDLYAVSAGGLAGTFQPHFSASYPGYTGKFPRLQDGDPTADGQGMNPLNPAGFADITFRMDGDLGRNLLHAPTASPDQIAPYQAPDMVQKQYGSYRIDPVFESDGTTPDTIRPSLKGFRIRDSQGKVYEYLQPVKNLLTTELTSTDPTIISVNRSVHILYDSYAVSWLLTAIKGPDYVPIAHSDGKPKEGDYGYWVKFNYTSPKAAAWSAPLTGNSDMPSPDEAVGVGSYQRANGFKELAYLSSIETETHKADFITNNRYDGYSAINATPVKVAWPASKYAGEVFNDTLPATIPDLPFSIWFPGDVVGLLSKLYGHVGSIPTSELDKPMMHIIEDCQGGFAAGVISREVSYTLRNIFEHTLDTALNYPDHYRGLSAVQNLTYDPTKAVSRFDFLWHYVPVNHEPRLVVPGQHFEMVVNRDIWIDVNLIESMLANLPNRTAFDSASVLTKINIYNKADPSTILKSIQFRYNYELCPGTPNSTATTTIDQNTAPYYVAGSADKGKLTLKEVQINGMGISMPPYRFSYQSGAGNPGYIDKEKFDIWGMYKADGSFYNHLTKQGNDQEGVCWNLTHIQSPLGGTMDVAYQRDSYYFAGSSPAVTDGKESVFPDYSLAYIPKTPAGGPDFTQLPKVNVPSHTPLAYVNDGQFLFPKPNMDNNNVSSEEAKLGVSSLTVDRNHGLKVGDFVMVVQVIKLSANVEGLLKTHNGIMNMALVKGVPTPTSLVLEPLIQKNKAGNFFLWKDFNYGVYNFSHEYYLIPVKPQDGGRVFYGGDVAVKSLTRSDPFSGNFAIKFDYLAKDIRNTPTSSIVGEAYASGATYGLPDFYQFRFRYFSSLGDLGLRMESNPDIDYGAAFTISRPKYDPVGDFVKHTYFGSDRLGGFYYPSPGITYSRVTTTRVAASDMTTNIGSTEYQFNGLSYYFLHAGSSSGGQLVPNRLYPDWSTSDSSNTLTITAAARTKCSQLIDLITWSKSGKVVSQMTNKYAPTATLYDKGTPKLNSSPGYVEQTYSSQIGVGTDLPGPIRNCKYILPSNLLLGTSSTRDGVTATVNFLGQDAISGQSLVTSKLNSDGRSIVTYNIPAYWSNSEMEADNALSQTGEERVYGLDAGETFDASNLSKVIGAQYHRWGKAYAGPDGSGPSIPTHKWHKLFSAVWNPALDSSGRPTTSYTGGIPGTGAGHAIPAPWNFTSNVTTFNRFTTPVETRDDYKSTFNATFTGYGANLPIGIVQDSKFVEAGIFTGDYDLKESGGFYFDQFNRWERGASVDDTAHISEVMDGPRVFGAKCVHVKDAFGPTLNVNYDNERHRGYLMSAWVYPFSGTTTMAFDFRDSQWQVIKDASGNPVPTGAVINVAADGGGYRLVQIVMPATTTIPLRTFGLRGFVGCPSGGVAYIQDIRFHPIDALATSYFYDPLTQKLLASVDENNHAKHFTYDGLNRLTSIKNDDRVIVSDATYQFYGP